jgi:hypothetical protein
VLGDEAVRRPVAEVSTNVDASEGFFEKPTPALSLVTCLGFGGKLPTEKCKFIRILDRGFFRNCL